MRRPRTKALTKRKTIGAALIVAIVAVVAIVAIAWAMLCRERGGLPRVTRDGQVVLTRLSADVTLPACDAIFGKGRQMRSVFQTMRWMAVLTALSASAALATPLRASNQYFDFTPGYQLLPGDQLTSVIGILSFADFVVPPTLIIDVFDGPNGGGALVDSTTLIVQPGGLGF